MRIDALRVGILACSLVFCSCTRHVARPSAFQGTVDDARKCILSTLRDEFGLESGDRWKSLPTGGFVHTNVNFTRESIEVTDTSLVGLYLIEGGSSNMPGFRSSWARFGLREIRFADIDEVLIVSRTALGWIFCSGGIFGPFHCGDTVMVRLRAGVSCPSNKNNMGIDKEFGAVAISAFGFAHRWEFNQHPGEEQNWFNGIFPFWLFAHKDPGFEPANRFASAIQFMAQKARARVAEPPNPALADPAPTGAPK